MYVAACLKLRGGVWGALVAWVPLVSFSSESWVSVVSAIVVSPTSPAVSFASKLSALIHVRHLKHVSGPFWCIFVTSGVSHIWQVVCLYSRLLGDVVLSFLVSVRFLSILFPWFPHSLVVELDSALGFPQLGAGHSICQSFSFFSQSLGLSLFPFDFSCLFDSVSIGGFSPWVLKSCSRSVRVPLLVTSLLWLL